LVTALKRFVEEGDDVRYHRWENRIRALIDACGTFVSAEFRADLEPPVPVGRLVVDRHMLGRSALEIAQLLQDGTPGIYVNTSRIDEGMLLFNPMCMEDSDTAPIADRLRSLLTS